MADFAVWAVACEEALGFKAGSLMTRYNDIRRDANELALDTSPVPPAVRKFTKAQGGFWQGNASELFDALTAYLQATEHERTLKSREWPKRPDKLSGALRRYAPNLRATGLEVEFERTSEKRFIILRTVESSVTGVTSVSAPETQAQHDVHAQEDDARNDGKSEVGVTHQRASQTTLELRHDAHDAAEHNAPKWTTEL